MTNQNYFRLAIVIPFYKIDFFSETLISIARQTNKNFSVYIGNDASESDPEQLIREHLGELPYNYVNFKNNLGSKSLVGQWKRVLDLAEGETHFVILGDDDYLSENFVEIFYKNLSLIKNYDVIKTGRNLIDSTGKILFREIVDQQVIDSTSFFVEVLKGNKMMSLSEFIFSFKGYQKFGIKDYPLAWHSDNWMVLSYSRFGKIPILIESSVFVRISSISISGKKDAKINRLKNVTSVKFYLELLATNSDKFTSEELTILSTATSYHVANNRLTQYYKKCMLILKKYSKRYFLIFILRLILSTVKKI